MKFTIILTLMFGSAVVDAQCTGCWPGTSGVCKQQNLVCGPTIGGICPGEGNRLCSPIGVTSSPVPAPTTPAPVGDISNCDGCWPGTFGPCKQMNGVCGPIIGGVCPGSGSALCFGNPPAPDDCTDCVSGTSGKCRSAIGVCYPEMLGNPSNEMCPPATFRCTSQPTFTPTRTPTVMPSAMPTELPTATPTGTPTVMPSATPTELPTAMPTVMPTELSTASPTRNFCYLNREVFITNFQGLWRFNIQTFETQKVINWNDFRDTGFGYNDDGRFGYDPHSIAFSKRGYLLYAVHTPPGLTSSTLIAWDIATGQPVSISPDRDLGYGAGTGFLNNELFFGVGRKIRRLNLDSQTESDFLEFANDMTSIGDVVVDDDGTVLMSDFFADTNTKLSTIDGVVVDLPVFFKGRNCGLV